MTGTARTPGLEESLLSARNLVLLGRTRRELLESHGWYRNLAGGWTHPHQMDSMSWLEIRAMTPAQLAYKLENGSLAELPPELRTKRKKGLT